MSAEPKLARVPVHDLDAEQALLSAVLLVADASTQPVDAALAMRTLAEIPPTDFYGRPNRLVWEACRALAEARQGIDVVTVAGWLKSRERLAEVGGIAHLSKVNDSAPSVANLEAYARIVRGHAKQRAIVATCQKIAAEGYTQANDVDEWATDVQRQIHALASLKSARRETMAPMRTIVRDVVAKLAAGEAPAGDRIFSGIAALDEVLTMSATDLVIVAARPGMGKSALAAGIAAHVATAPREGFDARVENGQGAAIIFSAEMGRDQIGQRLVCAGAKYPVAALRRGIVAENAWGALQQAAQDAQSLALWVDDEGTLDVPYIAGRIAQVKAELATDPQWQGEVPLKLVVVDYIQLMKGKRGSRAGNREQEIAEITRELKMLAKKEEVPIIALSQLNRGVETRANKRPTMADLRESGAIEQDADAIVFVYRDEYYDKESRAKGRVELLVEKQRNGESPARAIAAFDGAYTLFRELTDSERRQLEQEADDEVRMPTRRAAGGRRESQW